MPQAIAIVGMAGRFPGARNVAEFWANLRDGVESIRDLTDAELAAAGVSAEELAHPDYVRRASMLSDVPLFDAGFFGMSPRDAAIMDPQHRHFLEVAWEAMETAGHVPQSFQGSIGVFAGSGMNTYLIHNLLGNRKLLESAGLFQLKQTGNDKDVLATRVSYQFDLRGPSINIQTACSTSLVATHLACQSLLNFECDMALAGGVTIEIPHGQGYAYREGEILSRDGRCRAFDAASSGTVFGSGLGVVVLRRLEDAIQDHDSIRAVIVGSAVNNDGARKVGYLAPSVDGQSEVISEALEFAGLTAGAIGYVETHGTGTRVGDPIEVRALTQAFRRTTQRKGFCGIGSLKPSVGHLDAAAGVVGLIKTTLAIENGLIPESLHFDTVNPHIDLAASPFYVNNRLRPWPGNNSPRRAGVTSLGIGGTNAHLILEEAPQPPLSRDEHLWRLLTVSARSAAAADRALENLSRYLDEHGEIDPADAAYTCFAGRHSFAHRRAVVVQGLAAGRDHAKIDAKTDAAAAGVAGATSPRVVFLLHGMGAARVDMGRELYLHESGFRKTIGRCALQAQNVLGVDLLAALYPSPDAVAASAPVDTGEFELESVAHVALFSVQYALAAWWRSHGVAPAAVHGDAIGELVGACLAGSISLADALLAAARTPAVPGAPTRELTAEPGDILLELGPGAGHDGNPQVLRTLPASSVGGSELAGALAALGALWTRGVEVDLGRRFQPGTARRIPLPTYPFEHRRYWIESDRDAERGATSSGDASAGEVLFYQRPWRRIGLPEAAASGPGVAGRWLVFRDAGALSDELVAGLKAQGQTVMTVEAGSGFKALGRGRYRLRPGVREDYDALLNALGSDGGVLQRIVHLWGAALGERTLAETLTETLERSFHGPLALAQAAMGRDLAALGVADLDVAFVTRGLRQTAGEQVSDPARAVVDGVARLWPVEQPGVVTRLIDLGFADEDGEAARRLLAELNAPAAGSPVALRGSERWQQTLERFNPADASAAAGQGSGLLEGGVYLLTGGLGALGLVVARKLAEELRAKLVLVGRTVLPAEDKWEALSRDPGQPESRRQMLAGLVELRAVAGGLVTVAAEVTDSAALRAVIEKAGKKFGKLDGVFHIAGVVEDAPIALKDRASAERVLAPKVQGTLALAEALGERELGCLVLFSSISAVEPPAGQVDYAAANAFLDAFVPAYAASHTGTVVAINWGAWRTVGMAARTASPHPWLSEKLLDTPEATVFSGQFTQATRWVLAEHRFVNGQGLIPGTGFLELAAGAFSRGRQDLAVEFQNVFFLTPFMVGAGETRELRVQLEREPGSAGNFRFSLFGEQDASTQGRAQQWTEHATGLIAALTAKPAATVDRAELLARCTERTLVFDAEHRTRQERQLQFGPRWRSLRRLHLGRGEAVAELELDAQLAGDVAELRQHPALLDMATGAALYLTPDYEQSESLFLPISYQRIRVFRTLPARLWSHIRARNPSRTQNEIETFDIVVFDELNRVLAEIEGFAMRRIKDVAGAMAPGGLARTARDAGGERAIEIAVRPGIRPEAGALALVELLRVRTPATVLAVREPMRLGGAVAARAQLSVAALALEVAAAPRDQDLEATLSGWWREMLGVTDLSLDDDFFTLGGHSLVGVRLFARIKRSLGVDLELASLFEARTVRQLAALVRRRQEPAESAAEPVQWKSLVPVQPNGSRVPLFCVHAIGGDVIFYEQLARALGPDQPFYAFQSPLVAEPDRRDLTIEQIAALYIAEMRSFYPQGPYLLGGASYGGFVLYEMARQLHAQGIPAGLVAMFDVVAPGAMQVLPKREKYGRLLANMREGGMGYVRRKVLEKAQYFHHEFFERIGYPLGAKLYRAMRWPMPSALRFNYIGRGHWEIFARYRMEPFEGQITLVRANNRGPEVLGKQEDPTLGWGALVGSGLEVIDVPTEHMHMLFDPYVTEFVRILAPLLERASRVGVGV